MTREEARKKAEVMMAYANRKDVEFREYGDDWDTFKGDDCDNELSFNFNMCEYRIKPEPVYRPFKDKEECWNEMQKHQPLGWTRYDNRHIHIANLDNVGVIFLDKCSLDTLDYKTSVTRLVFTDGAPFGIKEE